VQKKADRLSTPNKGAYGKFDYDIRAELKRLTGGWKMLQKCCLNEQRAILAGPNYFFNGMLTRAEKSP